jgi:pyrophosphate--fructose-6-phosphate 1-phosphotransferase
MSISMSSSTTPPSEFSLAGKHVNVAMMTSGGLAPCLSSSIAMLVREWVIALRADKISGLSFRMYKAGYKGILIGDSFVLEEEHWDKVDCLNYLGGSPIGNSRVKVS